MKNKGSWSGVTVLALCLGLITSGCQQSNENESTSKVESAPVVSTPSSHEPTVQPATPTSTPVPVQRKDVKINGLMIGSGVDARNEIKNPTSKYHAGDSIFALVRTSGSGPEATIKLRCTDAAGNIVFEESKKVLPNGDASMVFSLTAANSFSVGEYRLVGLLDDYPEMAVSLEVSK